jgi:hypothetical protein
LIKFTLGGKIQPIMNSGSDNNNPKKARQKIRHQPNPLETFKDIGTSTAKQMREEVAKMPSNFMEQLIGTKPSSKKFSGELEPGEALDINEVFSGKHEELSKLRKQTALERKLLEEERVQVERKSNELRMQLTAVREEIIVLAKHTENLAEETQVAAMQAPVEPGVYHVIFFEKLLGFINSFRKKIEEAGVWLHAVNKRASKKNAWGNNYKKHGAKYLLSGEHYLQRSAG